MTKPESFYTGRIRHESEIISSRGSLVCEVYLRLVDDSLANRLLHYLLHRAGEAQQGRNSRARLQFLAFSLDSIMTLSR